jgi:hypothetical protein
MKGAYGRRDIGRRIANRGVGEVKLGGGTTAIV